MTATAAHVAPSAAGAPLRVAAAEGDDALALLDERWDELVARRPLPNPLLSATWLRAAARWRTGRPLVVVAYAGDALVAGAALELRWESSRFRPTTATWLGPYEQLFAPDALVDPARPDAAAAVLAAALDHAGLLRLERTPAAGAAAGALAEVAPWHRSKQTGMRWTAQLPLERRERLRRRLAAEVAKAERAGATVATRVAREPDEVAAALVRMFRLHRGRWGPGSGEEPRFATTAAHRRWNADVLAELAAAGRVRLAEILEDGETVGADLGLLHGHGAVAHTTARRVPSAVEHPGHLAFFTCLEALVDAGAAAADFGINGGGPGSVNHRFGSVGEPVVVLVAARSAARQRRVDALARLRDAGTRGA